MMAVGLLAIVQTSTPPTSSSGGPALQPAGNGGTPWPAGGRFVDAGFDTTDLANDIYADGLPPELTPQLFTFQRLAAGGWQAELDFPATVKQLGHYLNGDSNDDGDAFPDQALPVQHTVQLVLQPPTGDPTDVTIQPGGSTVVTKSGAQLATSTSVFVGQRVIIAVPQSVGIAADWTVQAVIRLDAQQPLSTHGGGPPLSANLVFATQPALVGVLDGDDAPGAEPLATRAVVHSTKIGDQPSDTIDLPAAGRPKAVHVEQDAKGVVVDVTFESPPAPLSAGDTISGQAPQGETLRLSLAPAVQDGLGVARIEVDFDYPNNLCGQPTCRTATAAEVLIGGQDIGTVPVTLSGNDVRFEFGGFQPVPPTNSAQAGPTVPAGEQLIGTFSDTETLTSQDLDMVALDPGTPPWPTDKPTTMKIDRTSISITSPKGETATGTINPFTGYFVATDADEMWSGFLGKEGWYEAVRTMQPAAAIHGAGGRPDLGGSQVVQLEIASYYWHQKRVGNFQAIPKAIRDQVQNFANPAFFNHVVSDWLEQTGAAAYFPEGYDPIVVPAPAAIPFPLATPLPVLAPTGGQWDLAVGVRINGAHDPLVSTFGPYVPASFLLTGATAGNSNVAGATPNPSTRPSSKTSSSVAIVVILLVVLAIALGGAAAWRRSARTSAPPE